MRSDNILFSSYDLRQVLEHQEGQMNAEIDAYPEQDLLGADPSNAYPSWLPQENQPMPRRMEPRT